MTNLMERLRELGQSVWLDYISRDLIDSGRLRQLVDDGIITGLTSNPTIFEKALSGSEAYDGTLESLRGRGCTPYEAFVEVAGADIRDAADILLGVYEATDGADGFVSLEVPPALAHDAEATINEARRLFGIIDRPNLMVKVPGTTAGVQALPELLAHGVNTNVTLLFSPSVYRQVAEAYVEGIERRQASGLPLDGVASVASFFVSRVDTAVDAQLPADSPLRGRAAVANARSAYGIFLEVTGPGRWRNLAAEGARPQRPLWASTSTKNPQYPDVLYFDALVTRDTVNTLPEPTLEAVLDHGAARETVVPNLDDAAATLEAVRETGIDLDAVMEELLDQGLGAFAKDFDSLLARIAARLESVATR